MVVANHQTAGRGRLGRRWEAPPGSALLVSFLLYPPLAGAEIHLASVSVALAASAACLSTAGVEPWIKWPNDLVWEDRKLAGVLAETVDGAGGTRAGQLPSHELAPGVGLVVGIGINISWPGPPEAHGTSLAEICGRPVSRDALLASLLEHLEPYRRLLDTGAGRRELVARFKERCATLRRAVRVELADRTVEGRAVDFSAEGHLVVEARGVTEHVAAGDVVHLRGSP